MKNFFNSIARAFRSDPNGIGSKGYTPLQAAIMKNDWTDILPLLTKGADINLSGQMICPPLHLALERDCQYIAETLIDRGADVNLQDGLGRTPLHHAMALNQDYLIRKLLSKGADPNIKDFDGNTAVHVMSANKPELVKELKEAGANFDARDAEGRTPLHLFLDRFEMLQAFLKSGASPNIKDNAGASAFARVLENKKLMKDDRTLQLFLKHNPDLETTVPGSGQTFLHRLVHLDMIVDFAHWMDRASLEARDNEGASLLHVVVRGQNPHLTELLLQSAPQLVSEEDAEGLTPLAENIGRVHNMPAVVGFNKFIAIAKTLIEHGADVNTKDKAGHTLMHFAAWSQRQDFAEYLFSEGAALDIADAKGKTPLHFAVEDKSRDFIAWLISSGAALDTVDAAGKAPLQYVLEQKNLEILDLLLDGGANPDLTDARGWTILDRLAEKSDRDSPIVQRLIVAGGQYNKQLPLYPELMQPRGSNVPKRTGPDKPERKQPGDTGLSRGTYRPQPPGI